MWFQAVFDVQSSPPLSIYSWKPAVVLPTIQRRVSQADQAEKGQASNEVPENELDRHVEDVLRFVFMHSYSILLQCIHCNAGSETEFEGP